MLMAPPNVVARKNTHATTTARNVTAQPATALTRQPTLRAPLMLPPWKPSDWASLGNAARHAFASTR